MAEKITAINPQLLVWARESSGTSLEEAEKKFDNLRSWESGEDFPTYAQIKMLGAYYRKPIAVFFFPTVPEYKNIPASCRTLPDSMFSVFNRDVVKIVDWARAMQINLYELNNNLNPSKIKLTSLDFNASNLDITAQQLRNFLQAPLTEQKKIQKKEDAFEYWRDRFYSIGVYVFKNAFKDNSVSGFCIYDEEFPVICINNSLAFSRQIFTLFHEIYHLIIKTSGVDLLDDRGIFLSHNFDSSKERLCNSFAGAFLVPDDDFTKVASGKKLTDNFVQDLSNLYGVSMEVIWRKCLDRNWISNDYYNSKRDEINQEYFRYTEIVKQKKKDSRGDYYNTQASYKGQHYMELAFSKYYSKKISLLQLADYMNMKISSLQGLASRKGWGEV